MITGAAAGPRLCGLRLPEVRFCCSGRASRLFFIFGHINLIRPIGLAKLSLMLPFIKLRHSIDVAWPHPFRLLFSWGVFPALLFFKAEFLNSKILSKNDYFVNNDNLLYGLAILFIFTCNILTIIQQLLLLLIDNHYFAFKFTFRMLMLRSAMTHFTKLQQITNHKFLSLNENKPNKSHIYQ